MIKFQSDLKKKKKFEVFGSKVSPKVNVNNLTQKFKDKQAYLIIR